MNAEDNPIIRAASSWYVAVDVFRSEPLVDGRYPKHNLAFLSYGMEALRECDQMISAQAPQSDDISLVAKILYGSKTGLRLAGVDFGSGERFASTDIRDGLVALFTDYDSKRPNDFSSNADREMLVQFRKSLGQVDKKLRTHVPDVDYNFYAWRGPITNLKPTGDDKTNETLHTHGRDDFCDFF